ncbi:VIT family protein [Undibacterium sp.]|uniref:VIT1/CCC1 transporter family protein n=1 Tax=Undibacterium sp. TaxID=1914977 RepID=UPI00374D76E7
MAEPEQENKLENFAWLRAAVLGANDGIVSTSSLILGVAASHAQHSSILISGIAGAVSGAMSMAVGEYVSVQSQADSEAAALKSEHAKIRANPGDEHQELADIYIRRGVESELAAQVAQQLMAHDALGAHARDELGITGTFRAKPTLAAFSSLASFSVGASVPLLEALLVPEDFLLPVVAAGSLILLMVLGAAAARTGGANVLRGSLRVGGWSFIAMGVSAGVGVLLGALA